MAQPRYFVGKGKLYISRRSNTGQPLGFEWLGNVPNLTLALEEQRIEHKESYTGNNLIDKVVGVGQSASASFVVDEYNQDNLEKFLFGTQSTKVAANIVNEALTAAVGKSIVLQNINLNTFTSLTSNDGATTYVNGTDYTVNLPTGMIHIVEGGAIADGQPLRANYSHDAIEQVSAFTAKPREYWLRFDGLNQAEDSKPVVIDVYNFRPSPIGSLEAITDEFGTLEIEGMVQYDALQPDSTIDGRFFKIRMTQQVG